MAQLQPSFPRLLTPSHRHTRRHHQPEIRTYPCIQGTSITPEVIAAKGKREWKKFLAKDLQVEEKFHELYPAVLGQLAKGIFVRESRFTWVVEQQVRFELTMQEFDS